MQSAERFGDFAIQLRMRIMTRPGEPYVIRRKAHALKKAFAENGVRFAFRTVQMTGRDEAEPASAQPALKLIKAAPPE